jgi:hypothetical protein
MCQGTAGLIARRLVPQEGIEPPTLALGVPCSILLSYWGAARRLYARPPPYRSITYAYTSSCRPGNSNGSSLRAATPGTINSVAWLTSVCPANAASCSRLAMFTVSPITV